MEPELKSNSVKTPIPKKLSEFHFSVVRGWLGPECKEYDLENRPRIEDNRIIAKTGSYTHNIINEKDIGPRIFDYIENENKLNKIKDIENSDSSFKDYLNGEYE